MQAPSRLLARSTTWRCWPTNFAIPSVPSSCLLPPMDIATRCEYWGGRQHMTRLFRMQTWPFLMQLGVFTLAIAVVSGLGEWLIGGDTPITVAHLSLLVG